MPRVGRTVPVARALLVRLGPVLAVVVGLLLMQSSHCDSGLWAPEPCLVVVHPSAASVDSPASPPHAWPAPDVALDAGGGLAGVLAICLVVLIAVIGGFVRTQRAEFLCRRSTRGPTAPSRPASGPMSLLRLLCVTRA